jgi:LPXTG-motif cell wall-anchored protein
MIEGSLTFITALIGLILSIVFLGVLYRRKKKQSHIFQMVAYQSLGSKKGVAALQVGNEILLLGIMPNGLRVLKTMEAKELIEEQEVPYSNRMEKLRKLKEEIDE